MKRIGIIVSILVLVFLSGCEEEVDDIQPVFSNVAENQIIQYGTELDLLNLGLKASNNLDGNLSTETVPWTGQFISDELEYISINDNSEVVITEYYKYAPKEAVIPSTIGGIPVTTIRDGAFYGNDNTQDIEINIVDTTAPTINGVSDYEYVLGTNLPDYLAGITATDIVDGDLTHDVTVDDSEVLYDQVGKYPVVYQVTDSNGNTAEETIEVFVKELVPPVITLSGDERETVELGEDYVQVGGTCTDNYDDVCVVTMEGVVDTSQVGEYTTVYTATDESENTTTITRTVTVVDTTPPVITLSGDERETVELGEDYVQVGGTCTDNDDDDVCIVTMEGVVDTSQVGEYTTVYTATDESDNTTTITRTVTVVDTTPPELSLNPMDSTVPINAVLEETGVTINDFSTTTVIIDSDLDLTSVGQYTITYTVTDSSGNVSIIERIIHVYEHKPEIQFYLADALTTIGVGSTFEDSGCTATINGETLTCTVENNMVNTAIAGVYTITYSVDYNGETYTHNRYVFVYDVNDNGVQTLYYRKEQEEGAIL